MGRMFKGEVGNAVVDKRRAMTYSGIVIVRQNQVEELDVLGLGRHLDECRHTWVLLLERGFFWRRRICCRV